MPSFLSLAVLQVTYGKQQKAERGTVNKATLYLRLEEYPKLPRESLPPADPVLLCILPDCGRRVVIVLMLSVQLARRRAAQQYDLPLGYTVLLDIRSYAKRTPEVGQTPTGRTSWRARLCGARSGSPQLQSLLYSFSNTYSHYGHEGDSTDHAHYARAYRPRPPGIPYRYYRGAISIYFLNAVNLKGAATLDDGYGRGLIGAGLRAAKVTAGKMVHTGWH